MPKAKGESVRCQTFLSLEFQVFGQLLLAYKKARWEALLQSLQQVWSTAQGPKLGPLQGLGWERPTVQGGIFRQASNNEEHFF